MTKFPVYRKYTNKETYFKIVSENEFEEIQIMGGQTLIYNIEAKQYPEKLRIMDMIACKEDIWIAITKDRYEEIKKLFLLGRA